MSTACKVNDAIKNAKNTVYTFPKVAKACQPHVKFNDAIKKATKHRIILNMNNDIDHSVALKALGWKPLN